MHIESYAFSTSQSLVTAAKRYRSSTRRVHAETPGWVLIFAHGAGWYKERFEPVITRLFELDEGGGEIMVEAWAIDAQTHGAAADMNESVIHEPGFRCSAIDYASAIAILRTSIFFSDAQIQRVVLIGEREGAAAASLASDYFSHEEPLPIENIILVDPFHSNAPQCATDEWPDRETARLQLSNTIEHSMLDNFMQHGLVRTETGTFRLCALLRHQEQFRDKKYLDWSSMILPVSTGVHLVNTASTSTRKEDLALFTQPFKSITENKDLAAGLYQVLTDCSKDIARRIEVFGDVRSREEPGSKL